MSTKSAFSILGLAHKFCLAGEGEGLTPEVLNAIAEDKNLLRRIGEVYRGEATILQGNWIDCAARPFVPNGWAVEDHQNGGIWKWDASKMKLYVSNNQKDGKVTKGHELRKELMQKLVVNANVLDYLLAHPHLIPEEWKGKAVFFWGTIYCDTNGHLFVRCLYWRGDRWHWHYFWLVSGWSEHGPALLRAG
jgi:hypothetical protein